MDKAKKADTEYPDITSTASATETTGIMPTLPYTDEEYAAFQELHGMEIPKEHIPKP